MEKMGKCNSFMSAYLSQAGVQERKQTTEGAHGCITVTVLPNIFWHRSKSHRFLSSVNVGVAEVVSRGSETAETPSSVIISTTAMGVAVNSETSQKRCWHSLTRVGRNLFWSKKETSKTLLLNLN